MTGLQFISRQLLPDEAVEGQVLIQGLDHVVAVAKSVGTQIIGLEAVGLRITNQVQPMLRPALAVVWRIEQSFDHLAIGIGRGIGQEGLLLRHGGKKPRQIKRHAPQQRQLVCRPAWRQSARL